MNVGDLTKYVRREDLLQALQNLTNRTDVQVLGDAEIKRATAGVEGFLSVVIRVTVSFCYHDDKRRRTEVFVLKCMPTEGLQSELVKSTNVFTREGLFFDKIVPLLKRASRGKVEVPVPMCYLSICGGDNDVIYMEDLVASGHNTPDPKYMQEGLDFEHCSVAMNGYGKLHGLSVVAEEYLPEGKRTWSEVYPELTYDTTIYIETPGGAPSPFQGFVDESGETILFFARQLDGLPKEAEASGKLRSVTQRIWHEMCKLIRPSSEAHNVISHGDNWMNNMMFRYESLATGHEKPVGVKFIDLQMTRYCHPCIDILFFIYTSMRKTLRVKHIDELISIYYNSFMETLHVFNRPPLFTLEEFRSDLFGVYRAFGHYCESFFCTVLLLGEDFAPSKAEDMTPEKFEILFSTGNSSAVRERFANDPHYRATVSEFVRDFVDAVFPNGLDAPESPLFNF